MTDRGCFALRLGLITTLPALITAVWLVVVIASEAVLHRAVGQDVERAVHALELSVWLQRHAHAAAWAVADPSVRAHEGAATRAALLADLGSSRSAIDLRSRLLLHGGSSELGKAVRGMSRGSWLSAAVPSGPLPAAEEGSVAFTSLTGDACPLVLDVAPDTYYNSGGRELLTAKLCAEIHDRVLSQGLTTAIARLGSRSRSLEGVLERLWEAQARLRLTVTSPGSPEAAAVNTTADEAVVVEAGAAAWRLLGDVLRLSDPWLRLGTTDLGALLVKDMVARAEAAYSLQRDVTVSAAVLVTAAAVTVLFTTLSTARAAILSARRLLHFLPEVAYKHDGVASALNRAYVALGIEA